LTRQQPLSPLGARRVKDADVDLSGRKAGTSTADARAAIGRPPGAVWGWEGSDTASICRKKEIARVVRSRSEKSRRDVPPSTLAGPRFTSQQRCRRPTWWATSCQGNRSWRDNDFGVALARAPSSAHPHAGRRRNRGNGRRRIQARRRWRRRCSCGVRRGPCPRRSDTGCRQWCCCCRDSSAPPLGR
jgi:hypothetical protein